jgi:NAD(P)-dependent dehydrogenase (short-subunit alcohol dehydrogenase family)
MKTLNDRVAVVTGAGGGLGSALASYSLHTAATPPWST